MKLLPRMLASLAVFALIGLPPGARSETQPGRLPAAPASAAQAQLLADAQAIVDAFAAEAAKVHGSPIADTPTVIVRNTPQLIFFDGRDNTLTVPQWETQPAGLRAVFRTFAGGGDPQAEALFRAFFNRFLVAHEMGHWLQMNTNGYKSTLYDNEDKANRIAVAFWRTQPGGERFLADLQTLADGAAAALPDPTPPGEDPVAYFGENYQALMGDPLKYGYYQFRFMADAFRDRTQLDFGKFVESSQAE